MLPWVRLLHSIGGRQAICTLRESETVVHALRRCRKEITSMKDVIDKYNNKVASGTRFKRIAGSTSLVLKRQKLIEHKKKIRRLIQLLNTAMIANILEGQNQMFVTASFVL